MDINTNTASSLCLVSRRASFSETNSQKRKSLSFEQEIPKTRPHSAPAKFTTTQRKKTAIEIFCEKECDILNGWLDQNPGEIPTIKKYLYQRKGELGEACQDWLYADWLPNYTALSPHPTFVDVLVAVMEKRFSDVETFGMFVKRIDSK